MGKYNARLSPKIHTTVVLRTLHTVKYVYVDYCTWLRTVTRYLGYSMFELVSKIGMFHVTCYKIIMTNERHHRFSRSRSREPGRNHRDDHNRRYRDERSDERNHEYSDSYSEFHDRWRNMPPYRDQPIERISTRSFPYYEVVKAPIDLKLGFIQDDPRGTDPTKRLTLKASHRGNGRNTESFDPASTLVRPDMRVLVGSNEVEKYNRILKNDDIVIVPELFGREDDWTLYYQFIDEIRDLQKDPQNNKGAEWIPWHEGAHLISKNPEKSPTFQKVIKRLCEYFGIETSSIGTRFNWYRDSSDWKPFHHDSAAFNVQRAKNQNITVGVSFGALRELAFIRAREYQQQDHPSLGPGTGDKCRIYFPQMNNGVFSFGRDVNILWKVCLILM